MANIVRRGEGTPQPRTGELSRRWRELINWDPFAEMMPSLWQQELRAFKPEFEVKETKDAFEFKADLPGVDDKELDIALTGNRLVVSGKREAEERKEDENYYLYERSYGTFSRAFTLPEGIDPDHIDA